MWQYYKPQTACQTKTSVPSFILPAKSGKSSKSLNTHGRELAVEENEDDAQISQIVHQSMVIFII